MIPGLDLPEGCRDQGERAEASEEARTATVSAIIICCAALGTAPPVSGDQFPHL